MIQSEPQFEVKGVREMYKQNQVARTTKNIIYVPLSLARSVLARRIDLFAFPHSPFFLRFKASRKIPFLRS